VTLAVLVARRWLAAVLSVGPFARVDRHLARAHDHPPHHSVLGGPHERHQVLLAIVKAGSTGCSLVSDLLPAHAPPALMWRSQA
jgi:hypothetical protein